MISLMALVQSCPREWTHPRDETVPGYLRLDEWIELARTLERGMFDCMFFADSSGGMLETYKGSWEEGARWGVRFPQNNNLVLLPALAAATEHLGFAATLSVTYHAPYQVAHEFSTLDHLTEGRVGWNIVTSYNPQAQRNGLGTFLQHDERYDLADEFMDVVYKLWEHSIDDDAVIADRESGVYADPSKIRKIHHRGARFNVEGPHMCEPSPQRTPLLIQAGSSPRGITFGARHGEVLFVVAPTPESAASTVSRARDAAAAAGRDRHDIKVLQGVTVLVGKTREAAEHEHRVATESKPLGAALTMFGGWTGIDASKYDLDTPLSTFDTNFSQGMLAAFMATAGGDPTIRDVVEWMGCGTGSPKFVGTPEDVADEMERWMEASGIDGFMITPATTPGSFDDFVRLVVPELQRRGLLREQYTPTTLRERVFGPGRARLPETHTAKKIVLDGPAADEAVDVRATAGAGS